MKYFNEIKKTKIVNYLKLKDKISQWETKHTYLKKIKRSKFHFILSFSFICFIALVH